MSSLQSDKSNILVSLYKVAAISGIVLYLASVFLFHNPTSDFFPPLRLPWLSSDPDVSASPTNISHLMFGILATWRHRKPYTDSWWRPNVTRGYLYFDVAPSGDLLPWSPLSPPPRVSDDIIELLKESKHGHPITVRMVHAILELFREEREGIDLHSDLSGFLSSHPQVPLLSLHHFDQVGPIFPKMNRAESAFHLRKAADVDQSRLLQQTICYHKQSNWSFLVSWGYSAHVYEVSSLELL
ncbi:hypothetical protein RJ639_042646 [Escallonia herrerae]|uniref:Uncharacterized protein n=1 Tax=Escallonia herrerae TaxID=1293975 RepID=A0AA88WGG3_9ASTE|nr:hypothetical protein RJ639_042646 [Escallonia herrerae]